MVKIYIYCTAILVFLVACSSLQINSSSISGQTEILSKINPGVSNSNDINKILGAPERISKQLESNLVLYEYDLVSRPPHSEKYPKIVFYLDAKTNIVQGYSFMPLDNKKFGLKDIEAIFNKSKFNALPIDYTSTHYIPSTQIYVDQEQRVRFEYRKSDDTVFGYHVGILNSQNQNISKNK
jgi:hypothetical protein